MLLLLQTRRDNLKAVLDNSGDLYDTLGYINEWLTTAADKVQALGDEKVDTQTEAHMVKVGPVKLRCSFSDIHC